jgi:hypothetical protein
LGAILLAVPRRTAGCMRGLGRDRFTDVQTDYWQFRKSRQEIALYSSFSPSSLSEREFGSFLHRLYRQGYPNYEADLPVKSFQKTSEV